ncbi:hypothetical protein JNUCC0626_13305 [Lentzea sp. JNUCC 0626]|uniref:hypothetical protein n=1 Tax=Lentzea sp. JNUCC 0626 TaxID=3367513 RepID=UPI003747CF89
MNRSSSPPSRWLRRSMIFGPVVVLPVVVVAVFLVLPALLCVVFLAVCLPALVFLISSARRELRAERHATPEMRARYEALSRLFREGFGVVLDNVDEDVAIMLVSGRGRNGSELRSVLRFDRGEFDAAGRDGRPTPVVFAQFFLDPVRAVVRHRVSVLAMSRTDKGSPSISVVPSRPRSRRETRKTDRLVERLAADIPSLGELDVLIGQVQSSTART